MLGPAPEFFYEVVFMGLTSRNNKEHPFVRPKRATFFLFFGKILWKIFILEDQECVIYLILCLRTGSVGANEGARLVE